MPGERLGVIVAVDVDAVDDFRQRRPVLPRVGIIGPDEFVPAHRLGDAVAHPAALRPGAAAGFLHRPLPPCGERRTRVGVLHHHLLGTEGLAAGRQACEEDEGKPRKREAVAHTHCSFDWPLRISRRAARALSVPIWPRAFTAALRTFLVPLDVATPFRTDTASSFSLFPRA